MTTKNIDTTLVSAGRNQRYTPGSVTAVIQRASSLVFESVAEKKRATTGRAKGELFYGRRGTLTHFALQDAMTELEGGALREAALDLALIAARVHAASRSKT